MKSQDLRKILRFDMWASAASLLFTIAGASLLAGWLDVPVWVPVAVGLALIPWVYTLWRTAGRTPLRRADVGLVVGGNVGWGFVAAVVLVVFPDSLSTSGKWIFGLFSLAVLALGIVEWLGLRDLRPVRRHSGERAAQQASET